MFLFFFFFYKDFFFFFSIQRNIFNLCSYKLNPFDIYWAIVHWACQSILNGPQLQTSLQLVALSSSLFKPSYIPSSPPTLFDILFLLRYKRATKEKLTPTVHPIEGLGPNRSSQLSWAELREVVLCRQTRPGPARLAQFLRAMPDQPSGAGAVSPSQTHSRLDLV